MPGIVRVAFLLFVGLGMGIAYNAWPVAGNWTALSNGQLGNHASGDPLLSPAIDMMSYAGGLLVGMLLWEIGSIAWHEMPGRVSRFLAAQMDFYRFILLGGACVVVLLYF